MFSFSPVDLMWGQLSSPVQAGGLYASDGDVRGGSSLQQQTGDDLKTLVVSLY